MTRARLQQAALLALACVATVVVTLSVLLIFNRSSTFGLVLILSVLLLVIAFSLPVKVLPAAALVLYAAVPARLLPDSALVSLMPIGTVLLVIWRLRLWVLSSIGSRSRSQRGERTGHDSPESTHVVAALFAGLFVAWAVISAVVHASGPFAVGWMISFSVAVFVPLTVRDASKEAKIVGQTWVGVGAIAGAYAVFEFLTGGSPLFGALYEAVGAQSSQHWSVYRAEVSFGHPLFAGAFLAVATALAAGTWIARGGRLYLAAAALSAAGVVSTLSRGSMVATIVAVALGLLLATMGRGRGRGGRAAFIALAAAAAIVVVFQLDAFNERANSVEAELSAGARDTGLTVAIQSAQYSSFLGTGPASSGQTASQFGTVVIENSFLQVLISLGLPGLLTLVGFLAAVFVVALRAGRLPEASALVALVIALSGFNGIDAVRATHLMLGLVVLLALHGRKSGTAAPDSMRAMARVRPRVAVRTNLRATR